MKSSSSPVEATLHCAFLEQRARVDRLQGLIAAGLDDALELDKVREALVHGQELLERIEAACVAARVPFNLVPSSGAPAAPSLELLEGARSQRTPEPMPQEGLTVAHERERASARLVLAQAELQRGHLHLLSASHNLSNAGLQVLADRVDCICDELNGMGQKVDALCIVAPLHHKAGAR